MKLKKYITVTALIGLVSIGGVAMANTEKSTYSLAEMKIKIMSSYNNLVEEDGVEVVKVSYSKGGHTETYMDRVNGKEQVDTYDTDGSFLSRILTTDFGKTFISIGGDMQEDGTLKYSAHKTTTKHEIAEMNKDLFNVSTIDTYLNVETDALSNSKWKQTKSSEKGIEKFTSEYGNVYINIETGKMTKREMVNTKGEVVQTIEVDVINPKSREALQLFSVNSPYATEEITNKVKDNFSN
ncbi:hypothetical protein [Faecalimicrobium sp. JNUCC 81]